MADELNPFSQEDLETIKNELKRLKSLRKLCQRAARAGIELEGQEEELAATEKKLQGIRREFFANQ